MTSYGKKDLITKDKEVHKQFCKVRNKAKPMTRQTQKQFENSLAKNSKENTIVIWQYIKSTSKLKEYEGITELNTDPCNEKSKLTSDNTEKAEILNNYFSSVFFTNEPNYEMPNFCLDTMPELDMQTFK